MKKVLLVLIGTSLILASCGSFSGKSENTTDSTATDSTMVDSAAVDSTMVDSVK